MVSFLCSKPHAGSPCLSEEKPRSLQRPAGPQTIRASIAIQTPLPPLFTFTCSSRPASSNVSYVLHTCKGPHTGYSPCPEHSSQDPQGSGSHHFRRPTPTVLKSQPAPALIQLLCPYVPRVGWATFEHDLFPALLRCNVHTKTFTHSKYPAGRMSAHHTIELAYFYMVCLSLSPLSMDGPGGGSPEDQSCPCHQARPHTPHWERKGGASWGTGGPAKQEHSVPSFVACLNPSVYTRDTAKFTILALHLLRKRPLLCCPLFLMHTLTDSLTQHPPLPHNGHNRFQTCVYTSTGHTYSGSTIMLAKGCSHSSFTHVLVSLVSTAIVYYTGKGHSD